MKLRRSIPVAGHARLDRSTSSASERRTREHVSEPSRSKQSSDCYCAGHSLAPQGSTVPRYPRLEPHGVTRARHTRPLRSSISRERVESVIAGDDRGGEAGARRARVSRPGSSRMSSGGTADQGGAQDAQPEALRRRHPRARHRVRHRSRGHGQDLSRDGAGPRERSRSGSSASCSPGRPSRRASAWAFCPAT